MIAVEHLVKRYGAFTAVDDVSIDVQPGQIHGFLGPNGAGKTTTIRIIAGLLKPTSGRVVVNGHDLAQDAGQIFRRKQRREQRFERDRIFRHARASRKPNLAADVESVERRIGQCVQDFAHPVGAEVGHQQAVAVLHAGISGDRGRQYELVGLARRVGSFERGQRIGGGDATAVLQRGDGLFDPVPALVAIHRIIAP